MNTRLFSARYSNAKNFQKLDTVDSFKAYLRIFGLVFEQWLKTITVEAWILDAQITNTFEYRMFWKLVFKWFQFWKFGNSFSVINCLLAV